MRKIAGKFLLGTAALTCPCHLPIFLILFGGTAFGAYLSDNLFVVGGILVVYFLFALIVGLKMARPDKDEIRLSADREKYAREF